MKRTLMAMAVAASTLLAAGALAQSGGGPGMMGGPGYGYGYGYGEGHGMMGGYGPGMMGGGYGAGPGMGWGGGPMMGGGARGLGIADLSAEQRGKIKQAQQDFWKKQWPLMQQMHSIAWNASDSDASDEQAARKNYEAMAALQKQMFDNRLELRKRIDAVLTPKQREEQRRGWSR